MSTEKKSKILALLDTKTKVMGLIALVVNGIIVAALPFLPSEDRITGVFICAIVLVVTIIGMVWVELAETKVKSKMSEQPSNEFAYPDKPWNGSETEHQYKLDLEKSVPELAKKLIREGFEPDVIIGVARSGLGVAALLSQLFDSHINRPRKYMIIPVVSLCKLRGPRKTGLQRFNNSFNQINFKREDLVVDPTKKLRALIVDDACMGGETLDDAKTYVETLLDESVFEVKTAAIVISKKVPQALQPKYYLDETDKQIMGFGGKVESWIEKA